MFHWAGALTESFQVGGHMIGLLRYMAGLLLWSYMKQLDEREQ